MTIQLQNRDYIQIQSNLDCLNKIRPRAYSQRLIDLLDQIYQSRPQIEFIVLTLLWDTSRFSAILLAGRKQQQTEINSRKLPNYSNKSNIVQLLSNHHNSVTVFLESRSHNQRYQANRKSIMASNSHLFWANLCNVYHGVHSPS